MRKKCRKYRKYGQIQGKRTFALRKCLWYNSYVYLGVLHLMDEQKEKYFVKIQRYFRNERIVC